MNPLSITAGVVGISEACLSVVKALNNFRQQYQQASQTVGAICTESTVINASLSQIQTMMCRDPKGVISRFKERPDLAHTFDAALTGCMVLFSCLEDEVANLRIAVDQAGGLTWKEKLQTVWKEHTMAGLLQQIRGQETALTLLLQGLQM